MVAESILMIFWGPRVRDVDCKGAQENFVEQWKCSILIMEVDNCIQLPKCIKTIRLEFYPM